MRFTLPCPYCGFFSCEDREKCYKEARFDIDRAIRHGYGSRCPGYSENGLGFLTTEASELLFKYMEESL